MRATEGLTDTQALWARTAHRAPALAIRRWLVRALLSLAAVPGALYLELLVRWSWNNGQAGVLALIVAHAVAALLAILPVREPSPLSEPTRFLLVRRLQHGNRADRLRALRRAVVFEIGVLFIMPPVMALVTDARLQWPAHFVVAVASWMVIWPIERIAIAQHDEAVRLSGRK